MTRQFFRRGCAAREALNHPVPGPASTRDIILVKLSSGQVRLTTAGHLARHLGRIKGGQRRQQKRTDVQFTSETGRKAAQKPRRRYRRPPKPRPVAVLTEDGTYAAIEPDV